MIDWQDWVIAAITFIAVMLWIVGVVLQWWQKEEKMKHVHFVGFRTDAQHSAAVKVWGNPTLSTNGTIKECGEILTPTTILWFLPKEQRSNRPNGHGKITNFGN